MTLTGKRKDSVAFAQALGYLPEELADEAVRRAWFTATPPAAAKVRMTGGVILVFATIALVVAALAGLAWWLVPVVLAGDDRHRGPRSLAVGTRCLVL